MPALAMGLGWAGYTLGLWGYCLLKGYNVTLLELADFRHVPTWASIKGSQIPPDHLLPVPGGLNAKSTSNTGPLTPGVIQGVLKLRKSAKAAFDAGNKNRKAKG